MKRKFSQTMNQIDNVFYLSANRGVGSNNIRSELRGNNIW
jgi:hypothetical protein